MPRPRNGGSIVTGPRNSDGCLADADRGLPHGADHQRADPRRERQVEPVPDFLADAERRAREAARTEGALVQALDRQRVGRRLRQDGER